MDWFIGPEAWCWRCRWRIFYSYNVQQWFCSNWACQHSSKTAQLGYKTARRKMTPSQRKTADRLFNREHTETLHREYTMPKEFYPDRYFVTIREAGNGFIISDFGKGKTGNETVVTESDQLEEVVMSFFAARHPERVEEEEVEVQPQVITKWGDNGFGTPIDKNNGTEDEDTENRDG